METEEPVNNGFIVSPMSQKITLEAGQIYEGEIIVAVPKAATESFTYEATLYPFSVTGDNYQMDFQTMSDWSQIVNWMTLEGATGTLEPNGKAYIKYKIKVPETAPAGGQYAMIGIKSKMDEKSQATVSNQFEMASLVYAEVAGETKHEGAILDNKVTGFVTNGVPEVRTVLQNKGNVHETAVVKLKVVNVFGGGEIQLSDDGENEFLTIVMPESTRDFSRELTGLPALGIFEVTQDISFLSDTSSVTTLVFICPIWFLALMTLTIIAIISTIVFGIKKRYKNRMIQ